MSRKAWQDLSEPYRHRLEQQGMTEELHSVGAPLKALRGHGSYTPSERARELERGGRHRPMALSQRYIELRERNLHYVPSGAVLDALDAIGAQRMTMVLEWQEFRRNAYANRDAATFTTPPGLQEYIEDTYGEESWDDTFDEWWDDDTETVFRPYH